MMRTGFVGQSCAPAPPDHSASAPSVAAIVLSMILMDVPPCFDGCVLMIVSRTPHRREASGRTARLFLKSRVAALLHLGQGEEDDHAERGQQESEAQRA